MRSKQSSRDDRNSPARFWQGFFNLDIYHQQTHELPRDGDYIYGRADKPLKGCLSAGEYHLGANPERKVAMEQEYPTFFYHHKLAPQGKIFRSATEAKGLKRKGWVNTPAKFPKPSKIGAKLRCLESWWGEWKWLFQAFAAVLSIIAAILKFWL